MHWLAGYIFNTTVCVVYRAIVVMMVWEDNVKTIMCNVLSIMSILLLDRHKCSVNRIKMVVCVNTNIFLGERQSSTDNNDNHMNGTSICPVCVCVRVRKWMLYGKQTNPYDEMESFTIFAWLFTHIYFDTNIHISTSVVYCLFSVGYEELYRHWCEYWASKQPVRQLTNATETNIHTRTHFALKLERIKDTINVRRTDKWHILFTHNAQNTLNLYV